MGVSVRTALFSFEGTTLKIFENCMEKNFHVSQHMKRPSMQIDGAILRIKSK